jgi:small subunit ribosomal protein S9
MADNIFVGRRKTSVARVILREGSGKVVINGRDLEIALPQELLREEILSPFKVTSTLGVYDASVNVDGGGITGQSQAIRLGISRALVEINSDHKMALKKEGFLTRDPRMVERKKYGRPKARKRFQFSKR